MVTTNLCRMHGNMDMTHKPSGMSVRITLELYLVCVCGLCAVCCRGMEWEAKMCQLYEVCPLYNTVSRDITYVIEYALFDCS